jgi:hypothetical protein
MGYLRVRTLANPKWTRDTEWLIEVMVSGRPGDPGEERDLFDAAIRSLRSYHNARRRTNPLDCEELWDCFLRDLDAYLFLIHRRHLDAVHAWRCDDTS